MRREEFFIKDYKELFAKIEHEFQVYQTLINEESRRYFLFNLLLSLNHLFDWVINDPDVPSAVKSQCVRRFNPYDQTGVQEIERSKDKKRRCLKEAYLDAEVFDYINPRQRLVRILANHEKHLTTPDEIMAFASVGGEHFFKWNMETREERVETERELKEAYGEKLPPHAQQWLETPKSVLSGDLGAGIVSTLVGEWKRFLEATAE